MNKEMKVVWLAELDSVPLCIGKCSDKLKNVGFNSNQRIEFKTKEECDNFISDNNLGGSYYSTEHGYYPSGYFDQETAKPTENESGEK